MCDTFRRLVPPTADCCCTWASSTKSPRHRHLPSRRCPELDEVRGLRLNTRVVNCLHSQFDVPFLRTRFYCLLSRLRIHFRIRFLHVFLKINYRPPPWYHRGFFLLLHVLQISMTTIFSRWSSSRSTTTTALTSGGTERPRVDAHRTEAREQRKRPTALEHHLRALASATGWRR